jgi:hypothetical protein
MAEFVYARSFRDLTVYKKSFALAKRVFVLSKEFSKEERFSLTDQIRRSSRCFVPPLVWKSRVRFIGQNQIRNWTALMNKHDVADQSD